MIENLAAEIVVVVDLPALCGLLMPGAGAQISCHAALNSIVAHVGHWLFAICHGG